MRPARGRVPSRGMSGDGRGETERFTITAISGTTIHLSSPLATARWGRLQYATATGLQTSVPTSPSLGKSPQTVWPNGWAPPA